MLKPKPIFGFFLSYGFLILICFLGCILFFPEAFISLDTESILSYAVSVTSLTHTNIPIVGNSNVRLIIFSVFVTQISGILFLTYLLFYCWQLFGSTAEKKYTFSKALTSTIAVSLVVEVGLFLFFMYGIPKGITDDSLNNKVLAALSLAINSFNNAGFSWWPQVIDHGFLAQNFIIQIGIIGGSVLGSLGVFVIYDLFSPKKLRERLNDSNLDWSFISKVSLFGASFILISGSLSYYIIESHRLLLESNLIESVFASIYEICSSRGFGLSLFENSEYGTTNNLRTAISILGGGPFSTACGLTVMMFAGFILIFQKKDQKTAVHKTAISLSKNLLYYQVICFSLLYISMLLTGSEISWLNTLNNQLSAFTNTSLNYAPSNGAEKFIQIGTVIFGRVGFIMACFLTLRQRNR